MMSNRLAAMALLALLAGCNGSGEKGPERKTAAGEVLGGSISDSMLPLDTVLLQQPPELRKFRRVELAEQRDVTQQVQVHIHLVEPFPKPS